jgi:hypothetical protein
VVSFTWREAYNYLFGPFPVEASELAAIGNPDQPKRYYLKVQGDKSHTTGMQVVDRDNKENVRAVLVALLVGKKFLLVKTRADNHQLEFKGALVAMPPEVRSGAVQPMEEKYPELQGAFLAFQVGRHRVSQFGQYGGGDIRTFDHQRGAISGGAAVIQDGETGEASVVCQIGKIWATARRAVED